MRPALPALLLLLPLPALAADWAPSHCGPQPVAPNYALTTREAYQAALPQAETYRKAAAAYAACALSEAHDQEAAISQAAQDKIAAIQAAAVARQQAIYAKLAAQSEAFRQAAKALNGTTR